MIILVLRTDKPEAELGLYDNNRQLAYITWQAHRQLAETIHVKIRELLDSQNKQLEDLEGIVMYQGPGSFTGLRIGLSVGNALASSFDIPVSGQMGDNWCETGINVLLAGNGKKVVLPEYGASVHITAPKK